MRKALLVFIGLVLVFAYAVCNLVKLQLIDGEYYRTVTINQSLSTTELTASRGTIYDATGKILAQSASVWTVALNPNYFDTEELKVLVSQGLAPILDMDEETIYAKADLTSSFSYLAKQIETETKEEVVAFLTENGISGGVSLIEDYKRYYPYGTTASVVIGFTGTDGDGLAGIEYQYNNELSGTVGTLVSAQNAVGVDMPFEYEQLVSAEDGYDLVLTIDETVQSICEKYLTEGIEKYDVGNSGAAIVMDVNTGAIIAMATGEQFDLNDPWTIVNEETVAEIEALPEDEQSSATSDALYAQWRNKAISDTYEPGSVFKDITAAAALDNGTITAYSTFECTGSYIPYTGVNAINCWIGSLGGYHGVQTVREAICNSCNPFFMQVAQLMGASSFFKYFDAFGFTSKTGIDLPGEATGIYYEEDELNPVELATESFGQGMTVTPIQMITAVSAIANGGYLVEPYVVDYMIDDDGNIIDCSSDGYVRQVISQETADLVIDMLLENATTGTANSGYVEGYRIAGKTGTSEKIALYQQDTSQDKEYIVSYCGFAPADDPQYALLVFFDEPDNETASGGKMAGPTFASIMSEILPYLGVEAQYDDSGFSTSKTTAPSLLGLTVEQAIERVEDAGLTAEVYGDADLSDIVLMQVPSDGKDVPSGGDVYIYTSTTVPADDLIEVPDFTGYSVSDCYYLAAINDIQVILTASTDSSNLKAQNQSISSGELVNPGTVVTVSLADETTME